MISSAADLPAWTAKAYIAFPALTGGVCVTDPAGTRTLIYIELKPDAMRALAADLTAKADEIDQRTATASEASR